jgi:hypothetical protein
VEEPASRAKRRTMSGRITVPVPMEVGSVSLRERRLGIVPVEPLPRGEEDVGGSAGEFGIACLLGWPVGQVQPRLVVGGHALHPGDAGTAHRIGGTECFWDGGRGAEVG